MKPYLADVILLVLQHYTAPQIREWLTEYKRVVIGRHAVGRFVKRIQAAVDNIDKEPATRTDAVLAEAIRKAAALRPSQALPPTKRTPLTVETPIKKEMRSVPVPAQRSATDAVAMELDPPQEIQGRRLPELPKTAGVPAPSGTSSRLIPSRAELDRKSAETMQTAGRPQLMSSVELARMVQDIENEAGNRKE